VRTASLTMRRSFRPAGFQLSLRLHLIPEPMPGRVVRKSTARMIDMRLFLAALCIAAYSSMASAQTQPDTNRLSASQPINDGAKSVDDNKGQAQPQGAAGPLTTGSGGASAASPQGGTPPNMQVVPEGASKSNSK
jgi:hypothetical protein